MDVHDDMNAARGEKLTRKVAIALFSLALAIAFLADLSDSLLLEPKRLVRLGLTAWLAWALTRGSNVARVLTILFATAGACMGLYQSLAIGKPILLAIMLPLCAFYFGIAGVLLFQRDVRAFFAECGAVRRG